MSKRLGDKLRARRKELGLTLDQVVASSGVSKSYLWELENKTPPRPSADRLAAIAQALGLTLGFLMDQSGEAGKDAAIDEAFFREYREKNEKTKAKIRDMVKLWSDQ